MKAPIQLLIALGLCAGIAANVAAQTRSIEEGPIVRRQLLYRSSRLEVMPALGLTLNDPYRHTMMLTAAANYHLTNTFSLGVNVSWGWLNYNTNLTDDIETVDPAAARLIDFSDLTLLTDFHLGYVPFYGKFNFLEAGTVNWDFHLVAGAGGGLITSDNSDLEGFKFAPMFGGGFRFFINGDTALTIDALDYMFESADIAIRGEEPETSFSHHVLINIGVSFFVTGDLRVSR